MLTVELFFYMYYLIQHKYLSVGHYVHYSYLTFVYFCMWPPNRNEKVGKEGLAFTATSFLQLIACHAHLTWELATLTSLS